MKILFVILPLFILTGCTGLISETSRRVVDENRFISDKLPKLSLVVDQDFLYLGSFVEKDHREYTDGTSGVAHTETEHFYFIQSNENKEISKMVEIRIHRVRSSGFFPAGQGLFSKWKPNLDSGTKEYSGENYDYIVAMMKIGQKKNSAFFADKGYLLPENFLVKGIGRQVANNLLFSIFYGENLDILKEEHRRYMGWNMDGNAEQIVLSGFLDRAESSFKIQ